MQFDWRNFSRLAESLSEDEGYDREARFRTAASRYYYSAHWLVRKLIERKNPGINRFRSLSIDIHRRFSLIPL
jgi:hypothetical protein